MPFYTFVSALTELSARLGGRTDIVAGTPSRANRWLNSACLLLAECETDVPELEIQVTRQTIADQSEYVLSASTGGGFGIKDLLGIRGMKNVTQGQALDWIAWREYRELNSQAKGNPVRWSRNGDLIAFDPQPQAVVDILLDYRRTPTVDSLVDFADKHHEVLITLATHIGWTALRQYDEAMKVKALLPAYVRVRIERPFAQYDWEAASGVKARLIPYGRN